MSITIDIPSELAQELESLWGLDLGQAAKEALAVESYRAGKIGLGQVAELLCLSINDANGFLKERGVAPGYTTADLDKDLVNLNNLGLPKP